MSQALSPIVYPDSDGKPMSDNTKQARWIVVLFGNLCALFRDRGDVFVAADLLWYPVEGQPGERAAPDVMVAFGRPKGDRGSYKQWEEDHVPVTVAFEVRSPNNSDEEMADKQAFYEEHGVEEYYLYDPDTNHLTIFLRKGSVLRREHKVDGFVSPRLKVRFDFGGPEMVVYRADGRAFIRFEDMEEEREAARQEAADARQEAADARQAVARMAELTLRLLAGQATAEEQAELARLAAAARPSP